MHSPWRVEGVQNYAFASAGSLITRHCELGASEYAFLPLLAFATRHCELEASNFILLPFCTFFLVFLLCLVS